MTHSIIAAISSVLGLYGLVFVAQIFAISRAKRRVRAAIAGDGHLESIVADDPAQFLKLCRIPEARQAYRALSSKYARLHRHMIGFFGLAATLFVGFNLYGLLKETYEPLALVDVTFAIALVLVVRVSGKISDFRDIVEAPVSPEAAEASAQEIAA